MNNVINLETKANPSKYLIFINIKILSEILSDIFCMLFLTDDVIISTKQEKASQSIFTG